MNSTHTFDIRTFLFNPSTLNTKHKQFINQDKNNGLETLNLKTKKVDIKLEAYLCWQLQCFGRVLNIKTHI
jgi:hypothetical protein